MPGTIHPGRMADLRLSWLFLWHAGCDRLKGSGMTRGLSWKGRAVTLLLTLSAATCSDGTSIEGDPQTPMEPHPDQAVLFHVGHENYAWFPSSGGFFVDGNGTVWRLSSSHLWRPEVDALFAGRKPDFRYPREALESAYEAGKDSARLDLPVSEVREKFALVEDVMQQPYSEPVSTGADIGITVMGALVLDPLTDQYQKVVIGISGDWTVTNQSKNAEALGIWLRDVMIETFQPRHRAP